MKLREGVRLVIEIEATANGGFTVRIGQVVGGPRLRAKSQRSLESEEAMWVALIRWAESRLAKLGLEKAG